MIKKNLKEEKEKTLNPPHSFKDYLKLILIILLVVSLGVFAVNQALLFHYRSTFLQTPCELCEELNPHLSPCFKLASTVYYDPTTGEEIENISQYKKEYWNVNTSKLFNPLLP